MKRKIAHFLSTFIVVGYFSMNGISYMVTGKPTLAIFSLLAAVSMLIVVLTDKDNE